MSFTQRIKDLTYQTPVTDYLKLRDEINADLNAVSQEDLNEFNDKFFTKYDTMKSKEWEKTLHVDITSHFYFTKQSISLQKNLIVDQ